jgi:hypothetical protein
MSTVVTIRRRTFHDLLMERCLRIWLPTPAAHGPGEIRKSPVLSRYALMLWKQGYRRHSPRFSNRFFDGELLHRRWGALVTCTAVYPITCTGDAARRSRLTFHSLLDQNIVGLNVYPLGACSRRHFRALCSRTHKYARPTGCKHTPHSSLYAQEQRHVRFVGFSFSCSCWLRSRHTRPRTSGQTG